MTAFLSILSSVEFCSLYVFESWKAQPANFDASALFGNFPGFRRYSSSTRDVDIISVRAVRIMIFLHSLSYMFRFKDFDVFSLYDYSTDFLSQAYHLLFCQ